MTLDEAFRCAWHARCEEWQRILDLNPPMTWLMDLRVRLIGGEFRVVGIGGEVLDDPFFEARILMLDRVTRQVHHRAGAVLFPLDLLPDAPADASSLEGPS
jgi:hypothetical protein